MSSNALGKISDFLRGDGIDAGETPGWPQVQACSVQVYAIKLCGTDTHRASWGWRDSSGLQHLPCRYPETHINAEWAWQPLKEEMEGHPEKAG